MSMQNDGNSVEMIMRRQQTHPPLNGFPKAAQIHKLPIFIGEAGAAEDASFLETHGIMAVISLGTGDIAPKTCSVLLVDILDMEEELILPYFEKCIHFLHKHIHETQTRTLVHCVYGQSRSATICVAYLMATQQMTMLEAYNVVQRARPCVYINAGFLRQLQLFERMNAYPDLMGDTPAHAELRTMIAVKQRLSTGTTDILGIPQLSSPRKTVHCRKCNFVLCSTRNEVSHQDPQLPGTCTAIFIEPMKWMTKENAFIRSREGKLSCPSCKAKLGSWNWTGIKCQCKRFVSPVFQLVPSRIEFKGR